MSGEKWSISTNEEDYVGVFDSEGDAIADGMTNEEGSFFVGRCVSPTQPEVLFDADAVDDWLHNYVFSHEDYQLDWADGRSPDPKKEQLKELAEEIRPVIAAWLDRHKLRPTFFLIDPKSVRFIENAQEAKGGEA